MIHPWLLAARPATLWAGVAPVLVAGALASRDDVFSWLTFLVTLLGAVAIQIGVNFANDVADAAKGADTGERIGPTRAVASGLISARQMWIGIGVAFGIAVGTGVYLISVAGPVIAVIGVASIVAALGYTNGPSPYGYRGWGEAFVFVFFGLVATVGARFVFDRTMPIGAWLAGIVMGLLATAILLANNIRDIETDAAAGKETLVVRVGREGGIAIFSASVAGAYVVVLLAVATDWLPLWTALSLLTLPLAMPLIRTIRTETAGPPLIGVLKGTARLQLIVALLLCAGILLDANL
ncbi:MAG: 1,4-dihydroxy-2-naphthoate polyprenyltransferase [bacterium]|nr:1,4-dihydroxy-2-naphthoate polyprenyltransferase [bacterium]